MKIRVSTLILTITIFQHFGELNATDPGEGASSGEKRKRGRPAGKRVNQDQFRFEDPNDGPPHRIVYYEQIEIKVWLDGLSVRKTVCARNYVPQGNHYRFYNFLIRNLKRADVTLVAYINQRNELIGVRPPDRTGRKHNLEPTSSEWYINYAAIHFKVQVRNSTPTGMSLMPQNIHLRAQSSFRLETVAGITFRLFRDNRDFNITGAELVSSLVTA